MCATTMCTVAFVWSGSGTLTVLGKRMSDLPVDPPLASQLLRSEALHCTADMIDIVAMQGADKVFVNPKEAKGAAAMARAA